MFMIIMVRGRRLKKVGGDLEAQKQNVAPLEPTIREQNVAPLELRVDESNNPCGLELAMVINFNSNDETPPSIDQKFQSKSGGLYCF